MKYYGSYATADGTRNSAPFEYTDRRKAEAEMRSIAAGATLAGSTSFWAVRDGFGKALSAGRVSVGKEGRASYSRVADEELRMYDEIVERFE